MHKIVTSYREIALADLPPVRGHEGELRAPTLEDLQQMGIVHIVDDIYSCIEQQIGEIVFDAASGRDVTVFRTPDWDRMPGRQLSIGDVRERHARLPAAVRGKVLRASVIRATDPVATAQMIAQSALEEQKAALAKNVGPTGDEGTQLVEIDPTSPEDILDEARRLLSVRDSGMERVQVPMDAVVAGADVIEAEDLIPHHWQGERL